jgi:hypothetical protein
VISRVIELQITGRAVIQPRFVDLRAVGRDAVRRCTANGLSGDVVVEQPNKLLGWWDAVAVAEIVDNPLSNALKFGKGRPVRIAVEPRKDGCANRRPPPQPGHRPERPRGRLRAWRSNCGRARRRSRSRPVAGPEANDRARRARGGTGQGGARRHLRGDARATSPERVRPVGSGCGTPTSRFAPFQPRRRDDGDERPVNPSC